MRDLGLHGGVFWSYESFAFSAEVESWGLTR